MIVVAALFEWRALLRLVQALAALLVAVLVLGAPLLGWFTQPWAQFWFGLQAAPISLAPAAETFGPQPLVSDGERYRLARAAGFNESEGIVATALSIAENGGGDPAALSAPNKDGSRDLGLWQVNSGWWPRLGGQAALIVPANNALAARAIFVIQGWCAWSTFEVSCGVGHTGSYRSYLARARAAAGSV